MNSQVMKCLGFCAADFWSSVAYESAETQTQTNSNLRLPLSSVMSGQEVVRMSHPRLAPRPGSRNGHTASGSPG